MAKAPRRDEINDERSSAETERIADATLKKLLSTPPKPFTKPAKGQKRQNKDKGRDRD